MILNINIKQIGKRRQKIATIPLEYKDNIDTVKEFIEETVKIMINKFNKKIELTNNKLPKAYSKEEIENLIEIGKVTFGLNNKNIPDQEQAIKTALQAYEDGLVRIFINDTEIDSFQDISELDINNPKLKQNDEIHLISGDTITFIRMTFLSGNF